MCVCMCVCILNRNWRKPSRKGYEDLYIPLYWAVGRLTSLSLQNVFYCLREGFYGSIESGFLKAKCLSGFYLCGLKPGGLCEVTLPRKLYTVVLFFCFGGKKWMYLTEFEMLSIDSGYFRWSVFMWIWMHRMIILFWHW